jgi:hypothetical protein
MIGAIRNGNAITHKLVNGLGQRVKSIEGSQLRTGRVLADARDGALAEAGEQGEGSARLEALLEKVNSFLPMKNDQMIINFERALCQSAVESVFHDTTDKVIIILCLSRPFTTSLSGISKNP